jgi:hypothetical protein
MKPRSIAATVGLGVGHNCMLYGNRRFSSDGGGAPTRHRRRENRGRLARGSDIHQERRDAPRLAVGSWRRLPSSPERIERMDLSPGYSRVSAR